jgi:membrane protein
MSPAHTRDDTKRSVTGALIAAGLTLYAIASSHHRRSSVSSERPANISSDRGRNAVRPGEIPTRGWWDIVKRVKTNIVADNIGIMAAGVAFYGLLSIFPGLTALISLYGIIANPDDIQQFIGSKGLLPVEAQKLLVDQISALVQAGTGKLGIGLAVSVTFALWSTNYSTSTLITALNAVYDEKEKRNVLAVTATSLALTAGLVLFSIFALLLIAVLPAIVDFLPVPQGWHDTIALVRWPILTGLAIIAVAAVYRYGPSREQARWRWVSWGAVFATIGWVAVSLGFSFYVSHFSSYDKTYGSLGAVIVLMMWLYLTAYIVLIGAELDAEMEHQTARDTTTGTERPLGARGARKADTVAD